MGWLIFALGFWAAAWASTSGCRSLAGADAVVRLAVPVLFGVTILVVWEGLVRGLACARRDPAAALAIAARFAGQPADPVGGFRADVR